MTLLLSKRFIEQILSDEKTTTRRAFRPIVKAVGTYRIRLARGDWIVVERFYEQRLNDMTESDTMWEGASSLDEFRKQWTELYDH
jgi:hypothetical protein